MVRTKLAFGRLVTTIGVILACEAISTSYLTFILLLTIQSGLLYIVDGGASYLFSKRDAKFSSSHVHNEEKQRLAGDIQNVMALEVPLPSPPHNVPLAGFSPVRHWDGTGKGLSASILENELRTASAIVIVAVDTLFLDEEFQVQLEKPVEFKHKPCSDGFTTHFAPALARSVDALGGVDGLLRGCSGLHCKRNTK